MADSRARPDRTPRRRPGLALLEVLPRTANLRGRGGRYASMRRMRERLDCEAWQTGARPADRGRPAQQPGDDTGTTWTLRRWPLLERAHRRRIVSNSDRGLSRIRLLAEKNVARAAWAA